MRIQAVYVTSEGRVRAEFRETEMHKRFEFSMSDSSGDLCFFMDNENEDNARLAAAAFNGDLTELRRLLDLADSVPVEDDFDLMSPKRQVWVAVWLAAGDERPQTHAFFSESSAEDCMKWESRRRIAVLGPIDAEGEP